MTSDRDASVAAAKAQRARAEAEEIRAFNLAQIAEDRALIDASHASIADTVEHVKQSLAAIERNETSLNETHAAVDNSRASIKKSGAKLTLPPNPNGK